VRSLHGAVALVTGAGREPARALALALAGAGCRLTLNDLTPFHLDETAGQARVSGAQVAVHVGDPSKGLFARGLLEETLDTWGQVDILVNCPRAEPRLSLLDLDEWDFQRTLEANTGGPFLLMQLLGRWLRAEGKPGKIINLLTAPPSIPTSAGRETFYTSQMALRALTSASASGFAAHAIQVFGISAGETQAQAAARQALALLAPDCAVLPGTVIDLWGQT